MSKYTFEIFQSYSKLYTGAPKYKLYMKYIHTSSVLKHINLISIQRVTQLHVLSKPNRLCKRKATGLDSVSARLLRECPDLISESLTLIFSQSIAVRMVNWVKLENGSRLSLFAFCLPFKYLNLLFKRK